MNQEPEVPQSPPLSRKLLWITLGIPPLVSLFATFFIPLLGLPPGDMAGWLILTMLMILLGLIPGLAMHFHDAMKSCYRGPSLTFLVVACILSQIMLSTVISVGSCILISYHYKI